MKQYFILVKQYDDHGYWERTFTQALPPGADWGQLLSHLRHEFTERHEDGSIATTFEVFEQCSSVS